MRADRLLSILLLLQTRGQMTARDLARALEVSERTVYRDVDSLSAAGVPVYGIRGSEGGFALVESYRTHLTGLTEGEVRALFMTHIPASVADLGLAEELRGAMLKLSAALPDARRQDEERVRQSFFFDSRGWRHREERVPHLQTVVDAVWESKKLHIAYRPLFASEIERLVAPYGLVVKSGVWYLVFARKGKVNAHPVARFLDVRPSNEPFARPETFDLAEFWQVWCAEHERFMAGFAVSVRVAPEFVPALPRYFGHAVRDRLASAAPDEADGWIRLELTFESFEAARERLLGFGRGVEVLAPYALRRSVLDYAEQIVDLYSGGRPAA